MSKEAGEINYEQLSFKAGLEIHQQLDTNKLFCSCPSVLRKDDQDYEISRRLHLVAGEAGEIDISAKHEASFEREFIYQGYKDTTCLVELDEEPPHQINQEALKIAVQIAVFLNCKILPISQIMRKTVIDGSNTSGFQRTVMIARDGYIETSQGKVRIGALFLEEDSARLVSKNEKKVIYKIDRLGIPLIEIATCADIKNAEHAKETALKIGEMLRSCKIKRGIGTIRQDINISIKGSNRVELKGFQEPKIMIKTVENEVLRQLDFIKKNKKNPEEVRNVLPDGISEFLRPMPGAGRMYPETDLLILKISRDFINEAKKTLPKLKLEAEQELRKIGLSNEMIKLLFKENKIGDYKILLEAYNKPQFVAKTLLIWPKEIATKNKILINNVYAILEDNLADLLKEVNKGNVSEDDVKDILDKIVKGVSLNEAIKIEKADLRDVEEKILKITKEKPGLSENAYMGLVMKEFKGKIDGKTAREIISKYLK